jgi:hypothetical protein
MSLLRNLGMIRFSIKGLHYVLYNLKMEEYLEDSLHKIGQKEKERDMIFSQKMIKLGYFHLIIKPN